MMCIIYYVWYDAFLSNMTYVLLCYKFVLYAWDTYLNLVVKYKE
jgi:hypothetical protein